MQYPLKIVGQAFMIDICNNLQIFSGFALDKLKAVKLQMSWSNLINYDSRWLWYQWWYLDDGDVPGVMSQGPESPCRKPPLVSSFSPLSELTFDTGGSGLKASEHPPLSVNGLIRRGTIGQFGQFTIDHFRIVLIWPGDRIRRPEHPTENEVRRCSCNESV